jgi:transcriptional regulator with XRE-family HTH domain
MAYVGKFAALLREGREASGLTQAALAERCHLTGSYISLLESGSKPPPSDKVVLRLAKVLSLDAESLLEVAHLDRAPADLRKAHEALKRRERIERELRERTAEVLLPFSVWHLFSAGGTVPGLRGAAGPNLDAEVVRALEALQEAARSAADMAGFDRESKRILGGLSEKRRRRLVEAAPLLAGAASGGGSFLATAPEPGLPPEIRPGDTLVVDPRAAPRPGDPVLAGDARSPVLARWEPALGAVRGVVVEVRRKMR